MTCVPCASSSNEKTLYDKTIARRVSTASRRTKRVTASSVVLGLLALGGAGSIPAAQAADYSGFTTSATATPLRIEVYEPAIPIPQSPQLELNFSYSKVDGASGPIGTARASALWPGSSVGEGLKTFGQQLGLPGALTDGGYPVQINAQSPGDVAAANQEFFPGNVGKVTTSPAKSVAKIGYGTSGDVDPGDGSGKSPDLLALLQSGDLSALGNLLSGAQTAPPGESPSSSPLGALAIVVNATGMESISQTSYDADAEEVIATATSRLGSVALLAGIIRLDGVEVITKVTSNIAGGAKVTRKVTIGAMSIGGQKFGFTGDGIEAMGATTPIPGLPDDPAKALAALGISFELGKAVTEKAGAKGSVSAEALRITVDTKPLLSKLPKLPLGDLINQLPDLPGQASLLKGLLLALTEATPKLSVVLGSSAASAETVAGFDGSTTDPGDPGDGGTGVVETPVIDTPELGVTPVLDNPTGPITTPDVVSFKPPGLPALGSIPMLLLLGGLALALGAGWYIRNAGLVLFGAAGNCVHGLKAGIPDLRKV